MIRVHHVLTLIWLIQRPSSCLVMAYRASESNPRTTTHASLVLDALSYLDRIMPTESNFRPLLSSTIQNNTDALTQGAIDADHEGGDLTIFGRSIDRNSLSHFYNPDTSQGYRAAKDLKWVQTLQSYGMLDGFFSQALGPAISARDMVDWYYARSVQLHRTMKDEAESVRALGYAAHLVADVTVPQHATDCGEENGDSCSHTLYENYVDGRYDALGDPTTSWEELFSMAQGLDSPGWLVVRGAELSAPLLPAASSGVEAVMDTVAEETVPMAKELTATLMLRYLMDVFEQNSVEAAVLQITRARMQGKLTTKERSEPDLVPLVRVVRPDGTLGEAEIRGYLADTIDAEPMQGIDGFGWSFVHYASADDIVKGEITFNVELWDVDANFRCGNDCGKLSKELFIDLGDKTSVNLTLALDNSTMASVHNGYSSGCDGEVMMRNQCDNTARIDYLLGRSYLINGVKEESVICDFADSVSRGGVIILAFLSVLAASVIFCIGFGCFQWSKLKYQQRNSKKY